MTDSEKPEAPELIARLRAYERYDLSDPPETSDMIRDWQAACDDAVIAADLLSEMKATVERFKSDRPFVVGFNEGWDEAIRQAASEKPEPNARALYVRTDIDTAEEIARLREALAEVLGLFDRDGALFCSGEWQMQVIPRARAALTDTARESNLHGADSNPVISHDAPEAAMQTPTDEDQACDVGDEDFNPATSADDVIYVGSRKYVAADAEDVRRKALEEAAEVADDYAGDCSTDAERVAAQIASAIRYATPPQPAPTVQEAADFEGFSREVMEAWPEGGIDGFDLQDIAVKHRLIVEVPGGFDPDRHEDIYGVDVERGDQWFERNYPRALSQQEGGE